MANEALPGAAAQAAAALAVVCAVLAFLGLPGWAVALPALLAAAASVTGHVCAGRASASLREEMDALIAASADPLKPAPEGAGMAALRQAVDTMLSTRNMALSLLEHFPFPIMTVTRAGTLRWMNRSMAGVIGAPVPDRHSPLDGPFFSRTSAGSWEAMLRGEWRGPTLHFKRDAVEFVFQAVVEEVGQGEDRWLVMLIDMTGSNLDAERIEAQRAEIVQLAHKIHGTTTGLEADAKTISDTLAQLVDTMRDSKDQASQVACAMQDMTNHVREVATMAAETANTAATAETSAREGMDEVKRTARVTRTVVDSYGGFQAILEELVERSVSIRQVTGIISDIADQTNLLALNAAIEAARAGDAGRGFAVVADEVRKLAEKTIQATKEVHAAVAAIDSSSRQAVGAMSATREDIERTAGMVADVEGRFLSIAEAMVSTSRDIGEIARRAESQCASSFEINMCAMNVTDNSEEVSEKVDHTSSELKRLVAEASQVRALAARYVMDGGDVSEHRRHDRIYVKAYASRVTCNVNTGSGVLSGEIIDISPVGARVRLPRRSALQAGQTVTLTAATCPGELGIEGMSGTVRWAGEAEFGLEFSRELPHKPHRMQELITRC